MLITFKSKAAADVIMYKTHAQPLFDLLGKSPDKGVITAEEIPDAIAKLEARIAESKRELTTEEKKQKDALSVDAKNDTKKDTKDHTKDDNETVHEQPVSFAVRAFPLLEMLRAAEREKQFVIWGV
jgi:Sec-independent protein translocase protein TatA